MEEFVPNFENVEIIKKLYTTKNSSVYLIRNKSNNGSLSILKGIKKGNVTTKEVEMIKRERGFYEDNKSKKNPFFPYFLNPFKDQENVYMEISFIQGLNLSQLILNDHLLKFNYSESNLTLFICLLSQIISMIDQLHKEGYIYRDLKLNNIIIDKKLRCYLVDFGFVKHFDDKNKMVTSTVCGTLHMKAPEIFGVEKNKKSNYDGSMVDIYSIGVLMYEMYMGKPPFPYKTEDEDAYCTNIFSGIKDEIHFTSDFYGNISNDEDKEIVDNIKDLIKRCMEVNASKRIKMNDIKNHKLFKSNFEKFCKMNENLCLGESKHTQDIIKYIEFHGEFEEDYQISEEKKKMDDMFNQFF